MESNIVQNINAEVRPEYQLKRRRLSDNRQTTNSSNAIEWTVNQVRVPMESDMRPISESGPADELRGDGLRTVCDHCQWMLCNWHRYERDEDFNIPHHTDTFQLEHSAANGCAICCQFWSARVSDDDIREARNEMRELGLGGYEAPGVLVVRRHQQSGLGQQLRSSAPDFELRLRFLRLKSEEPDWTDTNEEIREIIDFVVMMIPTQVFDLFKRPKTRFHGTTEDSLSMARRWLNNCQESHWKCNNAIEPFMPTRLVSTDAEVPHLFLGKDFPQPIPYATLSHCWGEMKSQTLLESNFESFCSRIPDEAMSKSIKHALNIARNLNLEYLWVDTLCIIQDSNDDWKQESSFMSSVYGSSSLNIAASGANSGDVGCFFDRPRSWRCQLNMSRDDGMEVYELFRESLYIRGLTMMPLMSRGWALQERLLPSRTLHFTRTEVFWECHHISACERFPVGLPWQCRRSSDFLEKEPINSSMWSWIVKRYTSCKLSYASDKLAAIAGLARYIQKQTKDQYLAGLWRDDLEFQLCWFSRVAIAHRGRSGYVAPTWSWASLDRASHTVTDETARFRENRRNTKLWITIHDVLLTTSGPDPFGPLSYAMIRLHCRLLRLVRLLIDATGDSYMIVNEQKIQCIFYFDARDTFDHEEAHGTYILPVFGNVLSSGTTGLLLRPHIGKKGTYKREGLFRFWNRNLARMFELAIDQYPESVAAKDCSEILTDELGNTRYVIDLI